MHEAEKGSHCTMATLRDLQKHSPENVKRVVRKGDSQGKGVDYGGLNLKDLLKRKVLRDFLKVGIVLA